jgi:acyl-CoA reductase-like NAD-dependent aldehyde dehydrogenase
LLTDVLEINTLELSKISLADEDTKLLDWLKLINAESEEEMAELAKKNPRLGHVTATIREMSADESERMIAEAREKELADRRAEIMYAEKIGEARGEKTKAISIARNLKRKGMNVSEISDIIGMHPSEIEKLLTD